MPYGIHYTSDAGMNANLDKIASVLAVALRATTETIALPTAVQLGDPFLIGGLYCIALEGGQPQQQVAATMAGIVTAKKATPYDSYMAGDTVKVDDNAKVALAGTRVIGIAVEDSDGSMPGVRTLLTPSPASAA